MRQRLGEASRGVPRLVLALACLFPGAVIAQHEEHGARAGQVPAEILKRPLPLRKGIGTIHDPVTTSSAQAQSYYDQGLAYLHSYVWIEAARSFHQALRIDSSLVMAYVG